jgi:hypothetical protein
MESITIQGELYVIGDRETINEKLTKREFTLKFNDGKFDQFRRVFLVNEKCDLLDGKKIGDNVDVSLNLRGRIANNGNTYNEDVAWKIV